MSRQVCIRCMPALPCTCTMPQLHARTAASTDADLPAGPAAAAAPAAQGPLVLHAPAQASTRQGLSQHPPAVSAGQRHTQPAIMCSTVVTLVWGPAVAQSIPGTWCCCWRGMVSGLIAGVRSPHHDWFILAASVNIYVGPVRAASCAGCWYVATLQLMTSKKHWLCSSVAVCRHKHPSRHVRPYLDAEPFKLCCFPLCRCCCCLACLQHQ
jgi:hypothetical protein